MATFVKRNQINIDGQTTLPREYFSSPELFAEELEKIFNRRWLCVGRADRLSNPGDYFVQDIGRESVIVLKDEGGTFRAYYNVCRHRGTRLCEEHSGQFSETITCPYHLWAYGLDGRLIGAPSTHDIKGFNKANYPLHRVAVDTWEGFLFIDLSGKAPPLTESFEAIHERASLYNLPNLKRSRQIVYDVNCNWKLLVQNYSECYHCAPVHPTLAKLTPPTNG